VLSRERRRVRPPTREKDPRSRWLRAASAPTARPAISRNRRLRSGRRPHGRRCPRHETCTRPVVTRRVARILSTTVARGQATIATAAGKRRAIHATALSADQPDHFARLIGSEDDTRGHARTVDLWAAPIRSSGRAVPGRGKRKKNVPNDLPAAAHSALSSPRTKRGQHRAPSVLEDNPRWHRTASGRRGRPRECPILTGNPPRPWPTRSARPAAPSDDRGDDFTGRRWRARQGNEASSCVTATVRPGPS